MVNLIIYIYIIAIFSFLGNIVTIKNKCVIYNMLEIFYIKITLEWGFHNILKDNMV